MLSFAASHGVNIAYLLMPLLEKERKNTSLSRTNYSKWETKVIIVAVGMEERGGKWKPLREIKAGHSFLKDRNG